MRKNSPIHHYNYLSPSAEHRRTSQVINLSLTIVGRAIDYDAHKPEELFMRKKLAYLSTVLVASFMSSGAQAAEFIQITGPSGNFGDNEVICTAGAASPCSFTRLRTY